MKFGRGLAWKIDVGGLGVKVDGCLLRAPVVSSRWSTAHNAERLTSWRAGPLRLRCGRLGEESRARG